jgi:hypothetical protein
MSRPRLCWQICSGPRRLQPRADAGERCNAHNIANLLRENLVLDKDCAVTYGVIGPLRAHRPMNLLYVVPSSHAVGERYGRPEFPGSSKGRSGHR